MSETEKACEKQKLTLQQEDSEDSGAVSRGAAGVDKTECFNEGRLPNSPTASVSPLPVTDAPRTVDSIAGSGVSSIPTMKPTNPKVLMPAFQEAGNEIAVQEDNGIHGQNRDSGLESASVAAVNTQKFSAVDVAKSVQSEQLASATPLGGYHGDTNTELGDAMQGQQVQESYDDKFQSLLKVKRQFDKYAIKSSPDYKRVEDYLTTTIASCKENRLLPIPTFNIEIDSEDSDEANSEAEIGPQVACSDLELGATSDGEMKKRNHTKDVSFGPRKSNRNKKANKKYKD